MEPVGNSIAIQHQRYLLVIFCYLTNRVQSSVGIKAKQQAAWSSGNYAVIGRIVRRIMSR